jgi:hypothetical protein
VKQKLTDQFIQKWYNLIATSSRGNCYGQFKMEFKLENYLLKLSPNERPLITKLRFNMIDPFKINIFSLTKHIHNPV